MPSRHSEASTEADEEVLQHDVGLNVQAHSMKGDMFGGNNANCQLVEGGQMVLLRQLS